MGVAAGPHVPHVSRALLTWRKLCDTNLATGLPVNWFGFLFGLLCEIVAETLTLDAENVER